MSEVKKKDQKLSSDSLTQKFKIMWSETWCLDLISSRTNPTLCWGSAPGMEWFQAQV